MKKNEMRAYAEDFIEYLVENREDDEGDLNELLAEYENAEE